MIDYFDVLRQPRKPWLDGDKLREEYQKLILSEHPDCKGVDRPPEARPKSKSPGGDAPSSFADVNEAYRVLDNPRLRLKHLLTLEGNAPSPAASAPEKLVELFSEMGALVRDIDVFLRQMNAAGNALRKSLLNSERLSIQKRTDKFLKRLQALYENEIEMLKRLSGVWDGQSAQLLEELATLYRRFAYLERWIDQLKERQFQLMT